MNWKTFLAPASKIAGGKALALGLAGLAAATVASHFSGLLPNGLLQFGPAPDTGLGAIALRYLIIWLLPAAIFYLLGSALSRSAASRIRPVDVFGTVAFALLPFVAMVLWALFPDVGQMLDTAENPAATSADMLAVVAQPLFIVHLLISAAVIALVVVWLFGAVRISCNLRGGRLWTVYLVGLLGGDLISRLLLSLIG